MKRLSFLLVLFLIFIASPLRAQIGEHRSQLSIGVNGGMVMNSVSFDPTIKQKQRNGITGGVVVRYTCEKYFSTVCALQLELNYAQLGWEEDIMNSSAEKLPDTYSRELDYVQLPMLARMAWGKEKGGLMFFILAGPQLGYYVMGSTKQSSTWTLDSEGHPDRPNKVYQQYSMNPDRKVDYGLTGGLGLEFNTKKGQHFYLEGRYYYGLNDIFNNGKKDVFSRSANMTTQVKFGYLFDMFNK